MHVTDETFAQRPVATVADICAALGVDPGAWAPLVPAVAELADSIAEWIARYRAAL
ncbi:Stf0 family sulfotransferase [Novosphingobium sp.]|uniref:Stf0 family sulfotransferase n=1 Tax=Novosphingobium sp. TaxID=1874826 RepID=UPI003D146940